MPPKKKYKKIIKEIQKNTIETFLGYGHREHRTKKIPLTPSGIKKQRLLKIKDKEQKEEIKSVK